MLLDTGSDIFELIYKPLDIDLIWHSPIGYRNPKHHVQSTSDPQGAFTDYYGGGWNDIFPNYGFASSNRGAKWGLHGESSLLPRSCTPQQQQRQQEEEEERQTKSGNAVSALLEVECVRYPLRAEKTISLNSAKALLCISEDIINTGEQSIEFSWAQHIAFGEPFVSDDLEVDIPAIKAKTHDYDMVQERVQRNKLFDWPYAPGLDGKPVDVAKIPPREKRVQEDFPILQLSDPHYKLYNPTLDLGVEVSWSREAFPYLWYWLNWGALDYPWFGRAHTLALEPTTSSVGGGLSSQIKEGVAAVLTPNSRRHGEVRMEIFQKKH